ncbi:MAG: phytanoyl-CoA dioxygenase family protein [Gammaproteobacteria bacterium]|nr:phytanoyl-CoA dioxygenase family protein [Gammaproteobacteria bacterium]MCZ6855018.1 phytanoyl-CoA dioxygenase family protein [Gammaproteobacteria bacterium]
MAETANPGVYYDSLPPDAISEELAPVIEELGLDENCRELVEQGWTVVERAASMEFNDRLREKIIELSGAEADTGGGGANMLLAKDPVFVEAVLNEKLLALAEFSVGRGFLISQVAASVRPKGAPSIGLHADHNWLPAPFPVHNMLLTGCWVCDEYTLAGGSTLVIPGSNKLKRHPDADEVKEKPDAIAIECAPGSVALWDGNVWHANWPRTTDGQRVVCHITYTRLMMRTVEDYRAHTDDLVAEHGDKMAQLLGQQDFLEGPRGADYSKLIQTFNNAKR